MRLSTLLLTALALTLSLASLSGGYAWEERLAECAALGIIPSMCPDDDSPLVLPVLSVPSLAPRSEDHLGSSDFGSRSVWVLTQYYRRDVDGWICYSSYQRFVTHHRGWYSFIDNKNVTMSSCIDFPAHKPINLVLEKSGYYN